MVCVEVPDHVVSDALAVGFYGVGHWCARVTRLVRNTTGLSPTSFVVLDGQTVTVEPDQWPAALALMATTHPLKFAEVLAGRGSFDTGDCLIQLACFGEMRY